MFNLNLNLNSVRSYVGRLMILLSSVLLAVLGFRIEASYIFDADVSNIEWPMASLFHYGTPLGYLVVAAILIFISYLLLKVDLEDKNSNIQTFSEVFGIGLIYLGFYALGLIVSSSLYSMYSSEAYEFGFNGDISKISSVFNLPIAYFVSVYFFFLIIGVLLSYASYLERDSINNTYDPPPPPVKELEMKKEQLLTQDEIDSLLPGGGVGPIG